MAWFVLKSQPCISSPEEEAEYLQIDCSDATLSAQLNSKSTREKYSSHDRRMVYSHSSLSGMMSRLLEPITRIQENTSKDSEASETGSASQEDSHAKMSPLQGKEPDWMVRSRAYGVKCTESLAKYDRDSSSWRTPQCLLFEDSTESLETLPNWGSLVDGELSELTMQVPRTGESASGSGVRWATPVAMDSLPPKSEKALMHEYEIRKGRSKPSNLRDQVSNMKIWPTPMARDWKGPTALEGLVRKDGKSRMDRLANVVRYSFPPPGITELSNGSGNGGQLNPEWVSWLMGWAPGWVSLAPMKKEVFEEWKEKAAEGSFWENDPAELDKDAPGYIPRTKEGINHRKEQLKALGNGQVPSCACMAEEILRRTE